MLVGEKSLLIGKCDRTPAPIAAQTPGPSVSVEIQHFKIRPIVIPDNNKTIRSYAKPAITNVSDAVVIFRIKCLFVSVDQHKIIPGSLIFYKIHQSNIFISSGSPGTT